jgi:hypothetical protein
MQFRIAIVFDVAQCSELLRNKTARNGWSRHGPLLPQQTAMVNDLPSFVNTLYRISSVGRWCNAKVPARITSVARLTSVIQLTFDPRLSQPSDYLDRCAPPIKVLFLRQSNIVRGRRMVKSTRWHSKKLHLA